MYLWLKALHLFFVVCWFAGIFYLPRLLVYYAACEDPATRSTLATMARKLYRFVTPFMVLTIAFGLALIALAPDYYAHAYWLHGKLIAVFLLILYHLQCGRYVRRIERGENRHGHVYYRFFNEIPVFFLLFIVIVAVLKPWQG